MQQAEAARIAETATVIAQIRATMQEYGITPADLKDAAGSNKHRTVAAKYRDPATGASWSGRGRAPRWLTDALSRGHSRDEFRIPG